MNITSVSGKNWKFKKFNNEDIKKYSEIYSLEEVAAKLLAIRKKNIENIDLFLDSTIKNLLPNPFIIKDMRTAIDRTFECIEKKHTIGIFGDYDVDGASSTALLARYFSSIKQNVQTYIPDRKKEGYGPSSIGFNNLISLGVKIIFTVDCGTLSFQPINEAQKKKIDIIVLDHHQSDIELPKAYAIVNPNRYDDTSKLNYLCAAGVCFMYLVALNKKLRDMNWFKNNNVKEPNILNFLDLVSLGTVCDVVPLIGLNRALVKQGLKVLKKRSNLGLKTLYDLCNVKSEPSVFDLGFRLGPRINAGGRIGKSSHGAELLICDDPQKAYQIANALDKSNKERQSIEFNLSKIINDEVKKYHNHPILVLAGKDWHEGVIGIIASKIKDKYNKPTIIISLNDNFGKGSARSVVGFDIGAQIIQAVQLGILSKGGGHKMAGGFTIFKDKVSEFRDFLIKKYQKYKINNSDEINLFIDTIIAPSALNLDFFEKVNFLGPFGSGNSEPRFVIENTKVIKSNVVGDNHISSILTGKDGTTFKTFTPNGKNSPLESILIKNNKINFKIAGRMSLNEWKGKKSVEFVIEDISLN